MKPTSGCKCCDPRAAATALGRWCLGIVFLFFGIAKFAGGVTGFARHLSTEYQKSWLPAPLVSGFGHLLPFLEVLLGVFLLLGLFRNATLFATGVLLIILTFGQVVAGQGQTVFFNTCYVFLAGALLFVHDYDTWVLFPRTSAAERASSAGTVPTPGEPLQY